jgi:hypothetical protein
VAWTSQLDIDRRFNPAAPPSPEQAAAAERLYAGARRFARQLLYDSPQRADQSAAVRLLDQAMRTAIAAHQTASQEMQAAWEQARQCGPNGYLAAPAYGPGLQGEVAGR